MAEVTFLTIEQAPNKTTYFAGDKFEKYGMLVRAHYDDNTSSLVDFYTFSPSGSLTTSDTQITISAFEKTVTQSITVLNPLTSGYFVDKCLNNANYGNNPYINTVDGSISFYNSPITVERDSYAINLVLSYHSRMSDKESDLINGFFKGFRTNYHRFLIKDGKDSDNVDIYKYIDGEGYIHTFLYNSSTNSYIDKDGQGLFLDLTAKTITDLENNIIYFNDDGSLYCIKNGKNPSNIKRVTYSSGCIRTICDSRCQNTYIKFSYNFGFLQYIRVYYQDTLLKTYTFYGFFGQITSIDETVGNNTRTLYQYAVNDRDRINRIIDCLSKEAYRITYTFDAVLNDYRFDSLRNGYMDNNTFIEQRGVYFVSYKYDNAAPYKLMHELVIRDQNNVELSLMNDSNGNPVSTFEQVYNDPNNYLSPILDVGVWVPFEGGGDSLINDSISKPFSSTLNVPHGLAYDDLDSALYIKLVGYIKIKSHPERAKLFIENNNLSTRFVDINPFAYDVWQYFEILIDRSNGSYPISFSSFTISLFDENNQAISAEICNLQFAKANQREKLFFKNDGMPICYDKIRYMNLHIQGDIYQTIDMLESPVYMSEEDLINTYKWKYSHPNGPNYAFFNHGRILRGYNVDFYGTSENNDKVFFLDPMSVSNETLGDDYNWFFGVSLEAEITTRYRFYEIEYEKIIRKSFPNSNQDPEDTISRFNYKEQLVKETNKNLAVFDYHFEEGMLNNSQITYSVDNVQNTALVYQATLDIDNKYISRVTQEGKSYDYQYDNYLLSKTIINDINQGQITNSLYSIEHTRDGFLSDLSKIEYIYDEQLEEEHNYSRASTSYKTNFINDTVTNYRLLRNIETRTVSLELYNGSSYENAMTIQKTDLFKQTTYNNSYGNNESFNVVKENYNAYGKLTSIMLNNVEMATIEYDSHYASQSSALISNIEDYFSNQSTTYTYNDSNKLVQIQIDSFVIKYYSDGNYSCTEYQYSNNEKYISKISEDKVLTYFGNSIISSTSWEYDYDSLLRVSTKTNKEYSPNIIQSYSYVTNHPSLVESYDFNNGQYHESYSYDKKGRLVELSATCGNVTKTINYEYDGFNRVFHEYGVSPAFTRTYYYKSDDGNPGPLGRMSSINNLSLTYDSKGRLSSYSDTQFSYDKYGNRLTKGNDTYQWTRGRLLQSVNSSSFTYDYQGLRTSKVDSDGYTHKYYYHNKRIVGEDVIDTNNNNAVIRKLRFFYDRDGLCAFRTIIGNQTKDYIYLRNALNDIVGIAEGTTIKALYFYDAWGNTIIFNAYWSFDSDPTSIGNINPFRYRSYYYDQDTHLYYLKTRYYDPEIGQFISPDDISYLDLTSITGVNLYAYCKNNPVMYYDPNGNIIFDIIIPTFFAIAPVLAKLLSFDDRYGDIYGTILYYYFEEKGKIEYTAGKLIIYDGYLVIGYKSKQRFLELASLNKKYHDAFYNTEYRNIDNYTIEWILHNVATFIAVFLFSPFGEYTGSRRLINAVASELLKHAKDVDMEDKEDWFELWKHLIK